MQTWVALLRGINVGGHHTLPMADLRRLLEGVGASRAATYIQSGNAAFCHEGDDPSVLSAALGGAIEAAHGFRPLVLVLPLETFEAALEGNPFPEAEAHPKSLHLHFLVEPPETPDLGALERLAADDERFVLGDLVLYLHAPRGIGRSKLAAGIERALGVPLTARNWRSATRIHELATKVRNGEGGARSGA